MDRILISDLEVFANHGVLPEETALGQKFLVSVALFLDLSRAGGSDELSDSIDYGEVARLVQRFMEGHSFRLLEAAAEGLAREILLSYPRAREAEVEVKKPWAPIRIPMGHVSVRIRRGWHRAYLSIGSNMGDKERNLLRSIELLGEKGDVRVERVSDFIETEPYGGVEQDRFLNAALGVRTLLSPRELLRRIGEIESALGRVRTVRWGPRTIDLDILLYDDLVVREEDLSIPHVGIPDREFVLGPMAQIAPEARHPILGKTIFQIYEEWKADH